MLTQDITIAPPARLESCLAELRAFCDRPLESMEVKRSGAALRVAFCAGAPPSRRLDSRITTVLGKIRASEDLRMSLEAAAASVHLSPGRFAHLFKEQLGLPFRRYMLWRKLTRAMLAIGRGTQHCRGGTRRGLRRCGAPDAHLPSDVRHSALGVDARRVLRDRAAVRGAGLIAVPSVFVQGSRRVRTSRSLRTPTECARR